MTRLADLAAQLATIAAQNKLEYEVYKAGRALEDECRAQLTEELRANELKQIKTDTATISLASRPRIVIRNEAEVMQWLRDEPDVEDDLYIGVKKQYFDSLAKEYTKQTGNIIPGTAIDTSEILSIRISKD